MQSSIAHPDHTPVTQMFIESHGGRIVIPDFDLDSSLAFLHFPPTNSSPLKLGPLRLPQPFEHEPLAARDGEASIMHPLQSARQPNFPLPPFLITPSGAVFSIGVDGRSDHSEVQPCNRMSSV